jgi:XTP/dITP diphosphohydrolase
VTPRLVVATANAGKVREFARLLTGLGYEVRALGDVSGLVLPPEGEQSYADNARGKARAAARATRAVALGDDSGLEVAALGDQPGPASARYGGPGLTDEGRVARLLVALAGVRDRRARFRCVLAVVAPWGEEALVEGILEGRLAEAPRGAGGFGYDPIFVVPELDRTLAELAPAEKDRVSHRARAVAAARPTLARWAVRAAGAA